MEVIKRIFFSAQPCQVPTITNGTTLHDASVLQPHQKLKYRCDDGYYNNDVKNVFCVTENQFSQPLPVCKRELNFNFSITVKVSFFELQPLICDTFDFASKTSSKL